MVKSRKKRRKGTFADIRLPVSGRYLLPRTQRFVWVCGVGLAAAALVVLALDYWLGNRVLISNGPLSSSHASLESECSRCHSAGREVVAGKCSECHEKHGDEIGVYTFAAHYLYRSGDFQRVVSSPDEVPCFECHSEHLGREEEITKVADASCVGCHDFGSFGEDHPDFDESNGLEQPGLIFPHGHHLEKVMERHALADVEQACLYCHVAQPEGRSFEPLAFDRSCDACHLTAEKRTSRLPLRDPQDPSSVGVESLAALAAHGGPESWWVDFANPRELTEVGNRITKSPIHHRDQWILANLRTLRGMLYDDPGLADLLRVSADLPESQLQILYEEAVATLESYALGLRSRPEAEIQDQLIGVEKQLRSIRRAIRDPLTPLDETDFLLALDEPRTDLSAETKREIEFLVEDLTQICRTCHVIDRATVMRVQKDQRSMHRAEFDHRAHILQVRCLDCHDMPTASVAAEVADRAEIQHLPAIESCRECHNSEQTSNRCVTCHFFHPNKSSRSDLLLYLDELPAELANESNTGAAIEPETQG